MLTDYHVHLRPDEPGTTAERYFTAENADRYKAAAAERGIGELGISEHVYRFEAALSVWDHPLWREEAVDDIERYHEFLREQELRAGIEADYVPGREDRMAALLERCEWDYVIGSVHFIGDQAVDYDKYDVWTRSADPDKVWRRYFELIAQAAQSGLYDIMAHPDLVKVWGNERPTPERDPRFYYEPAIEAIADAGIAIEVSTAGLRKPVGERYPSAAFLEMALDAGLPIALSSDAHRPEHLGHDYEATVEWLDGFGVTELAVFAGRARRLEAIG